MTNSLWNYFLEDGNLGEAQSSRLNEQSDYKHEDGLPNQD